LDYELAGQTVHTHYTFIAAELDPDDNKPLIYWSSYVYSITTRDPFFTVFGQNCFSYLSSFHIFLYTF